MGFALRTFVHALLFGLILMITGPLAASAMDSNCPAKMATLGRIRPVQIDVWRYFGQKDFNSSHHQELSTSREKEDAESPGMNSGASGFARVGHDYFPHGGSFYALLESPMMNIDPVAREMESGSEGNTLLDRNQFYPLKRMEETNYIDAKTRNGQGHMVQVLSPDQVTFFEVSESRSHNDLIEEFGAIPKQARKEALSAAINQYFNMFADFDQSKPEEDIYQLKVGASWLVSGQVGNKNWPLPLETSDLEVPLDRKQFKLAWEVGRAAQDRPDGFLETLRGDAYFAYYEMLVNEQKLDDAFMFGRAFDKLRARVYKSHYGMTRFSGYRSNPDWAAFVIPLRQLIEKVDIALFSGNIRRLIKASKGQLNAIDALPVLLKARMNRTQYLDSRSRPDLSVGIRDFSQVPSLLDKKVTQDPTFLRELAILAAPKSETRDEAGKLADIQTRPYVFPITGKNHGENLFRYMQRHNSVEVLIHQEVQSLQDAKTILENVKKYIQIQTAGLQIPESEMPSISVVTSDHYTAALFEQLQPKDHWEVYRPEVLSPMSIGGQRYDQVIRKEFFVTALTFSFDQVASGKDDFYRGETHRRQYLTYPELFRP